MYLKSSNIKKGVYALEESHSTTLYDNIWHLEHDLKLNNDSNPLEEQKILEAMINVTKLLNPTLAGHLAMNNQDYMFEFDSSRDWVVADVCAGHGNYSFALNKMGAKNVYSIDGSRYALEHIANVSKKYLKNQITPVQMNVENITKYFEPETFDLVIQRYAIHHMKNPLKTLYDLATLVKKEGYLTINYYISTRSVVRKLREHFLPKGLDYSVSFLRLIGKLKNIDNQQPVYSLKYLIEEEIIIERFKKTICFLQKLMDKFNYTVSQLEEVLHFENMCTPYIHDINTIELQDFACRILGLELYDGASGYSWDEHSVTLRVTSNGINKIKKGMIPHPKIFSTENINLGNKVIKATERMYEQI